MSQEFDIHRELWDYCDDNSRRIEHFHEDNECDILDNPTDILHLMDELDKMEEKKQEGEKMPQPKVVKKVRRNLDTASDIFSHMQENLQSNK